MALDTTKPTDQEMVADLPAYIREDRVAINANEASSGITVTNVVVTAGATALVVGTDLSDLKIEVALISGAAPGASISQIQGGTEGQIKIFVFQDNDISFVDGPKSAGRVYLNQLPALSTFNAQQDDVLALLNVDGDGASVYGYWKELWRQISVK